MFVIPNPALGGMKNLIISTESIREILRLTPQNDITTQSLRGEGGISGSAFPVFICDLFESGKGSLDHLPLNGIGDSKVTRFSKTPSRHSEDPF